MTDSVVDGILRDRELVNERRVAIARFFVFFFISLFDLLALFGVLTFTPLPPTALTVTIDLATLIYAAVVLGILRRGIYLPNLKYVVVTIDFFVLAFVLLVDPTVPKEGPMMVWIAFSGPIFFYMINLTRYSLGATVYATVLSAVLFLGIIFLTDARHDPNAFPISLPFATILLIGYSITASNKKMMIEANTKRMMERYLPPQLVDELYKENVSLQPGGEKRVATILFADIRSFTTLSESMPVGDVVALLNDYLSAMTDVVFEHEGTIDKFIGDAIMTTFGVPVVRGDDALRAVQTAIAMHAALADFNKQHAASGATISIGVGIHTGEVIAGNIGSDKRLDYTVIGDNVNLTSRIEGLTKFFQAPILISGATRTALPPDVASETGPGAFALREVGDVIVKGRSKPAQLFEVLPYRDAKKQSALQSLTAGFDAALALYRARRFEEADALFARFPEDGPSAVYRSLCRQYGHNPVDANWSSAIVVDEK